MQSHTFNVVTSLSRISFCQDTIEIGIRDYGLNLNPYTSDSHADSVIRVSYFRIKYGGRWSGRVVGMLCHCGPDVVLTGDSLDNYIMNGADGDSLQSQFQQLSI